MGKKVKFRVADSFCANINPTTVSFNFIPSGFNHSLAYQGGTT